MYFKPSIYLVAFLLIFQSCSKNSNDLADKPVIKITKPDSIPAKHDSVLTKSDSLVITWKNKPSNIFDTLRLLIYKSEIDYNTPFATPLFDTVFTNQSFGPYAYKYTKIYPKFKPGTYWFKIFSCNSPDIAVFHNQNDVNKKYTVIGGKTAHLDLTSTTDTLKNFIIKKITINKLDVLLSRGSKLTFDFDEIWNNAYADREPNKTLISIPFNISQLPYTINNLNVKLRGLPVWWSDPGFYIDITNKDGSIGQNRVDFTESFRKAKVYSNKVYVWNYDHELAYVLEGEWVH